MSLATRIGSLLLLGVILLTPIWLVEYPPLGDYPNHLASSFVLAHLNDPRFRFTEIYQANWGPNPYVAMDVILLALQRVIPVELAGRIFLSLCLLALPVAVWFFLHYANPQHDMLALWSLPFSYNIFFLDGYLSYYLSVAVCFVAIGLWLRYQDRPSNSQWIGLVVIFTILYFVHAIGFAVGAFVTSAHAVLKRQPFRRLVLLWLVFVPGAILYLTSRPDRGVIHNGVASDITFQGIYAKAGWFLGTLRGYSRLLDLVTMTVMAVCVVVALWKNSDFRLNPDWIGVATCLSALYWVLPIKYGAAWDLDIRVLPILNIIVLALARVGHRARWLVAAALMLFLIRTGEAAHEFMAEQPRLVGLARSFEMIPPHMRVLPLVEADRPALHFWAYGMIRQGWLSPYLFSTPGVHQLRTYDTLYRPGGFGDRYWQPPAWERIRETYDYVWAYNVGRFLPELDKIGVRVFAGSGLNVYRIERHTSDTRTGPIKK